VGPAQPLTLRELISACGGVELVEVADSSLDFPLLLPDPSWDVMFSISAAAARAVGMPQTPLARTAADTLAWDRERGEPPLRTGPTEEQERALLA